MLSAVVLTKNEEKNLDDCLQSLNFCDEIIVVDDYSTDKTLEIIQNAKIKMQNDADKVEHARYNRHNVKFKIFQRNLCSDFSGQRNFGLEKARGNLILFVDADERVSPFLAEEIIKSQKDRITGYFFKRKDRFLGKWLKHGETSQVKLLRLAKKNAGRWTGRVHEEWQVKGRIEEFRNPLLHDRKITIAEFLERINHYSSIRSAELYQRGEKTNMLWVTVYPLAKFFHNYILKLGFLDGIQGFIMAGMMSLHSFMARAKLWVRQRNRGEEEFKIKNWQSYV